VLEQLSRAKIPFLIVLSPEKLEERRWERQRAKIIAELERQATVRLSSPKEFSRHFYEILLSLIGIVFSAGVLIADKIVAYSGQLSLETGGRKKV